MIGWIWDNSDKLGALATVAASILALTTIWVVAWQTAASRSSAREATAMQAYLSYLSACVDRPHLGTWKMFSAWSGIQSPDSIENQTCEKCEAYVWTLSQMLMTLELAMISAKDDKSWISTVSLQVELHEPAVRAVWPSWKPNYSPSLAAAVETSLVALESSSVTRLAEI